MIHQIFPHKNVYQQKIPLNPNPSFRGVESYVDYFKKGGIPTTESDMDARAANALDKLFRVKTSDAASIFELINSHNYQNGKASGFRVFLNTIARGLKEENKTQELNQFVEDIKTVQQQFAK